MKITETESDLLNLHFPRWICALLVMLSHFEFLVVYTYVYYCIISKKIVFVNSRKMYVNTWFGLALYVSFEAQSVTFVIIIFVIITLIIHLSLSFRPLCAIYYGMNVFVTDWLWDWNPQIHENYLGGYISDKCTLRISTVISGFAFITFS